MRNNEHLTQIGLVLIGVGSGVWLIWQDILYLIPVMGLVASLRAYDNQKRILERERAAEKLRKELKELIQPKDLQDHSRVDRIIADSLGEIVVDTQS